MTLYVPREDSRKVKKHLVDVGLGLRRGDGPLGGAEEQCAPLLLPCGVVAPKPHVSESQCLIEACGEGPR